MSVVNDQSKSCNAALYWHFRTATLNIVKGYKDNFGLAFLNLLQSVARFGGCLIISFSILFWS